LLTRKKTKLFTGQGEHKSDRFLENLITVNDPTSVAAEAYRTLSANLVYTRAAHSPKVVVLTSSGSREGKSLTCANLGVALAQAGENTLIVDFNLRNPVMHEVFQLSNAHGVVDILTKRRELQQVWQEPLPRLKVITVGTLPDDSTELLGLVKHSGFVRQVRQKVDYVLIDTSAIGLSSDPAVLAAISDGVLLVMDAKTPKKSVLKTVRELEIVGANVIGTVINNVT
jgi:capsular exopolysaccharide synthesis family protein